MLKIKIDDYLIKSRYRFVAFCNRRSLLSHLRPNNTSQRCNRRDCRNANSHPSYLEEAIGDGGIPVRNRHGIRSPCNSCVFRAHLRHIERDDGHSSGLRANEVRPRDKLREITSAGWTVHHPDEPR